MKLTLKEMMIRTAKRDGGEGDYICTDGEWSSCTNLKEFEEFIKHQGFKIDWSLSTPTCTALVHTVDGYMFAKNGHCTEMFKGMTKKQYLDVWD